MFSVAHIFPFPALQRNPNLVMHLDHPVVIEMPTYFNRVILVTRERN